jgi:hypothetical protein
MVSARMAGMHRRVTALLIFGAPWLLADATLRYTVDFKTAMPLPGGAASLMPVSGPSVIRVKGDKTISTQGDLTSIDDVAANQTIYVDAAHMRYAAGTIEDFKKAMSSATQSAIPSLPPEVQGVMQMFRADVQTRKTGRTETIQGVRAEETELAFSLNMDLPPGIPLPPNFPAGGPVMRLVMQIWQAGADDVAKTPGLAEFARHNAGANGLSDNSILIRSLPAALPGMEQVMGKFMDTLKDLLSQPGVTLRTHMEGTSPLLAAAAPLLRAQGQALPQGLDANAPLFSMTSEIVEISTAPIDDSVFQIPEGYRKVEFDEILRDQFAAAAHAR